MRNDLAQVFSFDPAVRLTEDPAEQEQRRVESGQATQRRAVAIQDKAVPDKSLDSIFRFEDVAPEPQKPSLTRSSAIQMDQKPETPVVTDKPDGFVERALREPTYLGSALERGWNNILSAANGRKMAEYGEYIQQFNNTYTPEQVAADPALQTKKREYEENFARLANENAELSKKNEEVLKSDRTRPESQQMFGAGKPDRGWVESAADIGEAIISDPGSVVDLALTSGPSSLASMASALLVFLATKSPTAAAAAGGFTSGYVEFGNEYADNRSSGMDHDEAWKAAALKSGVVGLADAVSMKTAGKALDAVLEAKKVGATRTALKETAKETGRQAALGAGGEAGGSLAAGKEVDPTNVWLEAVGGTVTAPIEAVTTSRRFNRIVDSATKDLNEQVDPVVPSQPQAQQPKTVAQQPGTTVESVAPGSPVDPAVPTTVADTNLATQETQGVQEVGVDQPADSTTAVPAAEPAENAVSQDQILSQAVPTSVAEGTVTADELQGQLSEVDAEATAQLAASQIVEETPEPPAVPPERQIQVNLGNDGRRFVVFEDPLHKQLFQLGSRIRQAFSGRPEVLKDIEGLTQYLSANLNVSPQQARGLAINYREAVVSGSRSIEENGTFQAPAPGSTNPILQAAIQEINREFNLPQGETVQIQEAPGNKRMSTIAKAIKQAFGTDVVWANFGQNQEIKTNLGRSFGAFNGMRVGGRNAILLDATNPQFLNTLGHELTHVLETKYPQIYAELVALARERIPADAQTALRDRLSGAMQEESGRTLDEGLFESELVAEMIGEQAIDPQFWIDVFNSAGDRTFAQDFINTIQDIIKKLLAAMQGPQFVKDRKDLIAVREAATNAFQQWIQQEQTNAATTEATNVPSQPGQFARASDRNRGKSETGPIVSRDEAFSILQKYPSSDKRKGRCHELSVMKVALDFGNKFTQVLGVAKANPVTRIWHSVVRDPATNNLWEPISDRWFTPEAMDIFGFEPVLEKTAEEVRREATRSGVYPDQGNYKPRGHQIDYLRPGDYDPDYTITGYEPVSDQITQAMRIARQMQQERANETQATPQATGQGQGNVAAAQTGQEVTEPAARANFQRATADVLVSRIADGKPLSSLARKQYPEIARVYDLVSDLINKRAPVVNAKFEQMLNRLAQQAGGKAKMGPIKKISRAYSKVYFDYDNDPEKLNDIVRATLVLDTVDQIPGAIAQALQMFEGSVVKRNLWEDGAEPLAGGYRDVMFRGVSVDGMRVELQMNVQPMIDAKNVGHAYYKRSEELTRKLNAGLLTPDQADKARVKIGRLLEKQFAAYSVAFEEANRSRNSASLSGTPSDINNAMLNGVGSGLSQRIGNPSPGRNVTGTPLTSANSVPAGNEFGIGTDVTPVGTPDGIVDQPSQYGNTVATGRQYRLEIERRQRNLAEAKELYSDELDAILADARKFGIPDEQVRSLIQSAAKTKSLYPETDGWESIFVAGINVPEKDGAPVIQDAEIKWTPITYKYNVPDGIGRAPSKIDESWVKKVEEKFFGLIDEIYKRSESGDKNAQVIIGHQTWYRNVAEVLRREFGAQSDLFADLLGATSPNTPVDTNWRFSLDILKRFVRGDFNKELKDFSDYLAEGGRPSQYQSQSKIRQISGKLYGMNSTNAMLALVDAWRQINPGQAPKARNFALNLIGQSDMATIDVWAARMLRRAANMISGNMNRIPPVAEQGVTGSWNAKATAVTGEFGFGAEVMERVAKRLRDMGRDITAPDLQAIAWFAEKELWGSNGWTTVIGEGGSFEANIDASPMRRFIAGWSIQQGERVPNEGDTSAAQATVIESLLRSPGVISARVMPTKGLYGGFVEQSFDTEWTVDPREYDASFDMATIASIAKTNEQYDIFVSTVIQPNEENANARPGVEIYFRSQQALNDSMPILERFTSRGVDGFTMAVDPRATGENYIGVRLQYVPEISMRWDEDLRQQLLQPGGIEQAIIDKKQQLSDIAAEISTMNGVAFAKAVKYDTVVVGKENYDAYIARGTSSGNSKAGDEVWFGQPVRTAVERAVARLSGDSGTVDGAGVQNVSGQETKSANKAESRFSRDLSEDIKKPVVGEPFNVYRITDGDEKTLGNVNAGTARGTGLFAAMSEDYESAAGRPIPPGAVIDVWEVVLTAPVTRYATFNDGTARRGPFDSGKEQNVTSVGYTDKGNGMDPVDMPFKDMSVWFSFPANGDFTAKKVGSLSLRRARELLVEQNPKFKLDGTFDESGGNLAGDMFQQMFEMFQAGGQTVSAAPRAQFSRANLNKMVEGAPDAPDGVVLGFVPPVLQAVGVPRLPLVITKDKVVKIVTPERVGKAMETRTLNGREVAPRIPLSVDQLYALPQLISDPVAILKSSERSSTGGKGLVIITSAKVDGYPVIVTIAEKSNMTVIDGQKFEELQVTEITTALPKNQSIPSGGVMMSPLNRDLAENALYFNKERGAQLAQGLRLSLPRLRTGTSNANVLLPEGIVKKYGENAFKFERADIPIPRIRGVRFSRAEPRSLADDMQRQMEWVQEQAELAGYKDADEFIEKDYDGFIRIAAKWREQNPASVLFSRTIPPVRGNRFTLPGFGRLRGLARGIQNEVSRAAQVQQAVAEQGGILTDATDIESAMHRMYGRGGSRLDDFRKKVWQPLLDRAAKDRVNFDDVALYMYATHAPEANAQVASINANYPDGGSGMTNQDAADILKNLRQDPVKFANIKRYADQVQAITRLTQRALVDGDIVSQDNVNAWNATYKYYVPLKTFEQVNSSGSTTNSGRFDLAQEFSKRRLGRSTRAGAIIENILADYEDAVVAVERNNVRKAWLKFILDNRDANLWQVNRPVMTRAFYKNPIEEVRYRLGIQQDGNTLPVRVRGQVYHMVIEDAETRRDLEMSSVLSGTSDGFKHFFGIWSGINRTLGKLWTALSPAFILINSIRDTQTALINSGVEQGFGSAFKILRTLPKAAYTIMRAERDNNWTGTGNLKQIYDQYKADGGKTGFLDIKQLEDRQAEVIAAFRNAQASIGNPRSYHRLGMRYLKAAEDLIMDLNGAIEGAARVAAYKAALEAGKSRIEATNIAKEITVNFNRRGRWTPVLSSLYLFFNPAVQGAVRTGKAVFSKRGAVAASSLVGLGYMVALMAEAATGDDDEPYWDKPSYRTQKIKNLMFMGADGDAYTVPLPYGLGFFVTMGYAIRDLQRGIDPWKVSAFMRDAFFIHFSPLGSAENMATFVSPTIADPIYVLVSGQREDGMPLMPADFTGIKPDSERYWNNSRDSVFQNFTTWANEVTGGSAARPGKIDISPESLNYITTFVTGGAGTFVKDVVQSIDLFANVGADAPLEQNKIPVLRALYRNELGRADASAFYENVKKAEIALEEWKVSSEVREKATDSMLDRVSENRRIAMLGGATDNYKKALAALRMEDIKIQMNDTLDRATKFEMRRDLAEKMRQLQVDFNRRFYQGTDDR